MKRYAYYIIILIILVAVGLIVFTGNNTKERKIDQRITLRKEDKIPYGAWVAHQNLKHIFPSATITSTRQRPGYWDSLSNYESGQVLMIVSPKFYPDEFEMKTLIRFLENGNDLFISTRNVSVEVEQFLKNKISVINTTQLQNSSGDKIPDSLSVALKTGVFDDDRRFSYKGIKYTAWFYDVDTATTDVLGTDDMKRPNFIHLRSGKGNLFFHLAPVAFSNYFLLQGDNMAYYENALSVIPSSAGKLVWDEYFLNKEFGSSSGSSGESGNDRGNFLTELFKYRELKYALLTALLALLLYVLMEMRRKQRFIPVVKKPRNDSLDFVKTVGRLYYDKGNHTNLARKMAAYFLEHVRNKYKIPTSRLEDIFIQKLQFKTNADEQEIRNIVDVINYLDQSDHINTKQLISFHKQLESFYKKA